MSASNPDRVLSAAWTSDAESLIDVQIFVSAHDRRGLIRDLGDVVALERLSIRSMTTATDPDTSIASFSIKLAVHTLEQLDRLLARLAGVGSVIHARRTD
jgi:GTP pyrophosphokinase